MVSLNSIKLSAKINHLRGIRPWLVWGIGDGNEPSFLVEEDGRKKILVKKFMKTLPTMRLTSDEGAGA